MPKLPGGGGRKPTHHDWRSAPKPKLPKPPSPPKAKPSSYKPPSTSYSNKTLGVTTKGGESTYFNAYGNYNQTERSGPRKGRNYARGYSPLGSAANPNTPAKTLLGEKPYGPYTADVRVSPYGSAGYEASPYPPKPSRSQMKKAGPARGKKY